MCPRSVTALVLTVALSGCIMGRTPGVGDPLTCPPTRGQQLVALVNEARQRAGLDPLRVDLRLATAARKHAEDLAAEGVLRHEGTDGSLPATRVRRTGYPWVFVAENAGGGYASAAATFAGWQASAVHRANNMSPEARHIGVGYAENPRTAMRTYWVAVFGAASGPPLTPPDGCHP